MLGLRIEETKLVLDQSISSASNKPISGALTRIQCLASPINPSDLNRVQGTYPVPEGTGSVGGGEGVGRVLWSQGSKLKAGDIVVPCSGGLGWWRSEFECGDEDVVCMRKGLSIPTLSMMLINPLTALLMLRQAELKSDDWLIQSGANSAVGRLVIQMAKQMGLKSVAVVRDEQGLSEELKALGADLVLNEDNLNSRPSINAKLAFDCVAGSTTANLVRHLQPGSTVLIYGGMSRKPVLMPVKELIFRDIRVQGFWLTKILSGMSYEEKRDLLYEVETMFEKGILKEFEVKTYSLEDYQQAMMDSSEGRIKNKKLVFLIDK